MSLGTFVPDSGILRYVPPSPAVARIEAIRNRTFDRFSDAHPLDPRPASPSFDFPKLRRHEASADDTALVAITKGQPQVYFGFRVPDDIQTCTRPVVFLVNGRRWDVPAVAA